MSEQLQRVSIIAGQAFAFDPVVHVGLGALQIGDRVKIKIKSGYSSDGTYTGIIVGFEPFRSGPAVIIAYVSMDYIGAELKFLSVSDNSKDVEIIKATDADLARIDVPTMRAKLHVAVQRKQEELDSLQKRIEFFDNHVAQAWSPVDLKPKSDTGVQEPGS